MTAIDLDGGARVSIPGGIVRLVAAATVLLLVVLVARDAAALSRSPFDLAVAPARLHEGERATIRIVPAHAVDRRVAGERVDLYVVSVFSPATFLTPAGAWSSTAVPVRAGVVLGAGTPIVVDWPRVGPAGWIQLGLVTVREGADPVARAGWMSRPAETWLSIGAAHRRIPTRDMAMVGALAALTLAAALVVIRYPRGL